MTRQRSGALPTMKILLNDLRESNEFLNLLLDNINSAVLVADEKLRIHQFNEVFLRLFDKATNRIVDQPFGNATGCVNAVLEHKVCGTTSQCRHCILRRSLLQALVKKTPADHIWLKHIFYIGNIPTEKYLEFSTRHITFQGRKMVLVIIYDVTEIEKQKVELQEKQYQLNKDLEAAAGIQQSLLPARPPEIGALRFAWKFEPCGQIGGDIFNIQFIDDEHIGLYMLDVCGHGVAAALMSVAISQFLQDSRKLSRDKSGRPSPDIILNHLGQAFPFERFDSYFTIIYMIIDFTRGILTYSSAGHPPPLLLHADGGLECLDHHGPVIGLYDGQTFEHEKRQLQPGDKIVLYTDGVVEIGNSAGEWFGKTRFYETACKYRHELPRKFVDSIYAAVKNHGAATDPEDDISLLALEYVA